MRKISWVRYLFARLAVSSPSSRKRSPRGRAATAPPRLEPLEDRLAPAVALSYAGPGSLLSLTELLSGATPTVSVSETSPNRLTIDLGAGHTFDSSSTRSATGLTYSNGGQSASIDISTANTISTLQAALPGDALDLVAVADVFGGLGNISASAAVINVGNVSIVNAVSGSGNVSLTAAGNLSPAANAGR